jgi:hypothetical protein
MTDRREHVDGKEMRRMEREGQKIARVLDEALNPIPWHTGNKKNGFCLFLFSFEGPEMTYVSNAQRPGIIKLLEETLARWKKGEPDQLWSQRS